MKGLWAKRGKTKVARGGIEATYKGLSTQGKNTRQRRLKAIDLPFT
jgi:hypothetical protein